MPELAAAERAAAQAAWRACLGIDSVQHCPPRPSNFDKGYLAGKADSPTYDQLAHYREERRRLTEALLAARVDIIGVNAAQFDSTRGEVAVRAVQRIDAALAARERVDADLIQRNQENPPEASCD